MKLLQEVTFFVFLGFCACSGSSSHLLTPSNQPRPTPSQATDSTDSTDPTCCDPNTNEDLKEAWRSFTKDGRYRLARKSADYPAYAFTLGDLGYASDDNRHHMAAIVEDTSRTENARFGAVIFSAPTGENGAYHQYWLLRERDLSQAYFFKVSGYLELHWVGENGSREICDIRWNARSRQYNCRKP